MQKSFVGKHVVPRTSVPECFILVTNGSSLSSQTVTLNHIMHFSHRSLECHLIILIKSNDKMVRKIFAVNSYSLCVFTMVAIGHRYMYHLFKNKLWMCVQSTRTLLDHTHTLRVHVPHNYKRVSSFVCPPPVPSIAVALSAMLADQYGTALPAERQLWNRPDGLGRTEPAVRLYSVNGTTLSRLLLIIYCFIINKARVGLIVAPGVIFRPNCRFLCFETPSLNRHTTSPLLVEPTS